MPASADLTRAPLAAPLNQHSITAVVEQTLSSAQALVKTWDTLEPIIRSLIKKVQTAVDEDERIEGATAAKLLELCASVSHKLGSAATNVLRASEGQAKLVLLVDAGKIKRTQPGHMSEAALARTVIATVKRIKDEQGFCPICSETIDAA